MHGVAGHAVGKLLERKLLKNSYSYSPVSISVRVPLQTSLLLIHLKPIRIKNCERDALNDCG